MTMPFPTGSKNEKILPFDEIRRADTADAP
jgi:hypothetical protein